ncbi:MAG: cytochrome P450 [Micrococcaceae bacterium]
MTEEIHGCPARERHDFDPTKAEDFDSAHRELAEVRSRCPVARSQEFGGFWAMLGYPELLEVITGIDRFTTRKQNAVPSFAFTGVRPPLHLDPPEHMAYRRVINRFFTPPKMREIEPKVRRCSRELLEPLIARGDVDIATEYAQKLPAHVFAEFFNLSVETSSEIKRVSGRYVDAIQVLDHDTVKELSGSLYAIAQQIIDERASGTYSPEEDLTAALLDAEYQGEPLPPQMILGCVRQLIVTGMVAPSVFIGNMFVHLSRDPQLQDELRNDPEKIPAAVEEFLRLYNPYRGMARTARFDTEVGGQKILKDDPIALVYTAANRDPRVFENPDDFVLDRPNIRDHISFGRGTHSCPGAPLARIMLRVTLQEALSRSEFALTGNPGMAKWAEWGTNSVPLEFIAL